MHYGPQPTHYASWFCVTGQVAHPVNNNDNNNNNNNKKC